MITIAENKLADLSADFAVKILKLTDGMKGHYSLVNQLERSEPVLVRISGKRNMCKARQTVFLNSRLR